ncbi:MAG: hypothetical protein LBU12_04755 [Deltaproteobacteria bacterium]|jgi:hypothetical protein|nr:hypothetical protein [Deltaproteobacteria bacterium]
MAAERRPPDRRRDVFDQKKLLFKLVERNPQLPPDVVRLAGELVLELLHQSLSVGRPVALRGFGRFIPRRYDTPFAKKFGLLFHPSPRLTERINAKKKRAPRKPPPDSQ